MGQKHDVCRDHAIANIDKFIQQLAMPDPPVSVTMQSPDHDGTGRYQFMLHRGQRTVPVDMPGLPYDEVFCTRLDRAIPPRLYVDGNSWLWCFAIDFAVSGLRDHDGAIEAARRAHESDIDAELERQPRCQVCNNVRDVIVSGDDDENYEITCVVCHPRLRTRLETTGGAVYGDPSEAKRKGHYRVTLQHMPSEVPGHDNPFHPDALCGARIGMSNGYCRRRARHDGKCEPHWKVVERIYVPPQA